MPRNNEDFITGSYKTQHPDETKYFTGTGENKLGTQSGAYLNVNNPETRYILPDEYNRYNGDGAFEEEATEKNGQIPLFSVRHKPPVLDYMVATKDSTPQAMSLASHAIEETRRRFGERPLASDNTSSFSTDLVNKAIQDGIIKGVEGQDEGELARVSNYMGWSDSVGRLESVRKEFNDNPEYVRQISQAAIQNDAKNVILEALQNRKSRSNALKGTRSPQGRQFTQGQLFEK